MCQRSSYKSSTSRPLALVREGSFKWALPRRGEDSDHDYPDASLSSGKTGPPSPASPPRPMPSSRAAPGYLADKTFRRLTFDMMLAWEAPSSSSQLRCNGQFGEAPFDHPFTQIIKGSD
ncbi:hypothetical protein EJB05_27892 [Eragrostis curvula]|uniref:Uncharacterized protein n=1 Tax=Eragrostis curvula TaxID=38414 RepID=A0A5J9UQA2_9POAL|nr:hypothetical protein EJB05_27892 [Eragrostis curvula]